jgi:pyridoxine 5-phosphate synthase
MIVDISFEPAPPQLLPVHVPYLKEIASRLLQLCGRPNDELSVLLVTDQVIAGLNSTYRRKHGATNVLAFSQAEGPEAGISGNILGDIVISYETAAREARRAKITLHHRLLELMIHGLLHLLGYDHESSEADDRRMRDRERKLLMRIQRERRKTMVKLAVNVDHVATIRQARGISEPDPVLAAGICELAGAEGIVVHLREDRRHIQDRDVQLLRQTVQTKLNLEMGAAEEIIAIALELQPDMVTLVPEKRKELTTEGGLNVAGQKKKIKEVIGRMTKVSIPVSLFIDPDSRQIQAAAAVGATFVEIHTGRYAEARRKSDLDKEFDLIRTAAEEAFEAGLRVNAGHGLNYFNTSRIAAIEHIEELSIGHAIISRAVFVGLDQAVREMLALFY